MPGDVGHRGSLEPDARVVPPQHAARRMLARVEAAAREIGQVDPADEGDAVVHDHELLVMAVHGPLASVEPDVDPRPAREPGRQLLHLGSRRVEEGQRRARPDEQAHRDPVGELGEQLA